MKKVLFLLSLFLLVNCDLNPANFEKESIQKEVSGATDPSVLSIEVQLASPVVNVNEAVEIYIAAPKHENEIVATYFDYNNDGIIDESYSGFISSKMYTFSEPGEKEIKVIIKDSEGYIDMKVIKVTVN